MVAGLSALIWQPLLAAEINGLYQASITVTSRDDLREREQAFKTAMRKVLVKLTGRVDTLDNPIITRALANAQPESFAYRSTALVPATETQIPATAASLAIEVSFSQTQIQSLLDSAAIPLWPSNRPDTLLWVVVQDESGERALLGNSGNDMSRSLQTLATDLGLPLISPILDLQDQLALRAETLWNMDLDAIRAASSRYQTDSILVLKVLRLFGGQVIARAVYLFRGQPLEVEVFESELPPFLEASINMVAKELAGNYAILQSGINESQRVSFIVDSINGIADYAGMLRYLETLAVVKTVQVLRVQEHTVELELGTGGQLRQLIEGIALDQKMLPVTEPLRVNQQVTLHYQWQSP